MAHWKLLGVIFGAILATVFGPGNLQVEVFMQVSIAASGNGATTHGASVPPASLPVAQRDPHWQTGFQAHSRQGHFSSVRLKRGPTDQTTTASGFRSDLLVAGHGSTNRSMSSA